MAPMITLWMAPMIMFIVFENLCIGARERAQKDEDDLLSMEISEKFEIFQNFITFSGLANDLGCAIILYIHPLRCT